MLVRPGGGDGEMAGALFEIDLQLGEAAVEPAPPVQRHRRVAGGGEQRMREVDPVAVELDDALLLGHLDVVDNVRQRLEQGDRGAARAATATSVVADVRRKYSQPFRHEGAQTLGSATFALSTGQRPRQSPARARVRRRGFPGDLVHAHQLRSCQVEPNRPQRSR